MQEQRNIFKTKSGYDVDCSDQVLVDFIMHYDKNGVYVSQTQGNIIDENPPFFVFKADIIDGVPCVNGKQVHPLTKEQMEQAI